jgi:hypothetical protein
MGHDPLVFQMRNHEPDLCELAVSETQGGDETLVPLNVEATFGPANIHTDRVSIRFAIRKAFIKISVENGEISRKTKLANSQRENVVRVETEHSATTDASSEKELNGSLGLFGGGLRAGIGTRANARRAASKAQIETFEQHVERILALPGGKWQIQEVRSRYLIGRYLGDENICDLQIDRDNGLIQVEAYFDINDLVVLDCVDSSGGKSRPISDAQVRAVAEALVKRDLRKNGSEFTISDASIFTTP